MSDGMDELNDLIRHQQGQRQIGATNQVVSELQRQNELLQRQNQALQPKGPPCPFCGGDLPMRNAEVCKHCRKDLAWVQGVPCKPGQERQLRAKLEERAKKRAAEKAEFDRNLVGARKRFHQAKKEIYKVCIIASTGFIFCFASPFFLAEYSTTLSLVLFCGGTILISVWGFFFSGFSANNDIVEDLLGKYGSEIFKK